VRTVPGTGSVEDWDAVLVGGGVMSATLGVLLAQAEPDRRVLVVERLDEAGCESSAADNNAGTGHAGLCEFNYTPRRPDGTRRPGRSRADRRAVRRLPGVLGPAGRAR
jgi:malate dehydrogenase (quinone)